MEKKNAELNKEASEIELYQFTLQNLHEDIYWIDSNGKIIQVNESASKTSGYSREELLNMSVFDLNPTDVVREWPRHWEKIKGRKP